MRVIFIQLQKINLQKKQKQTRLNKYFLQKKHLNKFL